MGGGGGGTGDGGGGQGVYCSDAVNDPNLKGKLLVRDIYEAIKNHNRSMPSGKLGGSGTVEVNDAAIDHLVTTLKSYFGPASVNLNFVNAKYWKAFSQNISFIAEDASIYASQDANSPLALPNGCKMVQIAYWDESSGPIEDGTLWVDKKKWMQLDQFNKIALLAHEFFFKQARKAGFKNSDFVRHKVGQLLSEAGLPSMFQNWVPAKDPRVSDSLPESRRGFKFCEGTTKSDPSAKLHMYQYQGSDKLQHIVFPLVNSSSLNFSEFQAPHVVFDENLNSNISLITNTWAPATYFSKFRHLYDIFKNPITNFRFDQSDLLLTKRENIFGHFPNKVVSRLTEIEYQDVSWTLPIQSNSKPLVITLHNPFTKFKKSKVELILKTKEELILSVNKDINRRLKDLFSDDPTSNKRIPSLMILFAEVDEMISNGTYDKKFPRWSAELDRLSIESQRLKKASQENDEQQLPQRLSDNQNITRNLPNALYALKSNTYTAEHLLDADINPYVNPPKDDISLRYLDEGVISFAKGDEKIIFTLRCMDYIEVYRERTDLPEYKREPRDIEAVSFKVVVNEASFKSEKESFILASLFAKALKDRIYRLGLKPFLPLGLGMSVPFGDDANSLLVNTESETDVEVSSCASYGVQNRYTENNDDYEIISTCMILNLKKSNQKYMVLFSQKKDSEDIITDESPISFSGVNYILRIP
jgi:hypothetical protein